MLEEVFYGNTILQWFIALSIVVGSVVVGRILYWLFKNIAKKFSSATATKFDDILIDTIEEPLTFVLTLAGFYWAISTLALPMTLGVWISKGFYFLLFITAAWLLARLFDVLVQEYIAPKVASSENDLDELDNEEEEEMDDGDELMVERNEFMMEFDNMQQLDDAMTSIIRNEKNIDESHVSFNQLVDKETIQHFLYRDFPDEIKPKKEVQEKKYTTEELVQATKSIDPKLW